MLQEATLEAAASAGCYRGMDTESHSCRWIQNIMSNPKHIITSGLLGECRWVFSGAGTNLTGKWMARQMYNIPQHEAGRWIE